MDIKTLIEDELKLLVSRQWKGNARELQNVIKRPVICSKNDFLAARISETMGRSSRELKKILKYMGLITKKHGEKCS